MATATKTKPPTATDAAGDVLQMVNRMTMAEHTKLSAGRQSLARMVRSAADNQPLDEQAVAKALADAGEIPAAFAAEVAGLIKRRRSLAELVRLRHIADVLVPETLKEEQAAADEFAPVMEAHLRRVEAIKQRRLLLADEVSRGDMHRRWNAIFGRGTPKTLTIRAELHAAEVKLAEVRTARDHWEAKAGSKLYAPEVLAEAKAAFDKHKELVAVARGRVEELKQRLEEAERAMVTDTLQVRFDKPIPAPTPVGGSVFPNQIAEA